MRSKFSNLSAGAKLFILAMSIVGLVTILRYSNEGPSLKTQLKYAVEKNQADRMKILHKFCARDQLNSQSQENWRAKYDRALTHILVDEKHHVLYCPVPKAGWSAWKAILAGFIEQSVKNTGSLSTQMEKNGIKTLANYSEEEILHRLGTYHKFMFVRNPISRLISSFRDKIVKEQWSRTAILKYSNILPKSKISTKAHFKAFVKFLMSSEGVKLLTNVHFERYENLCAPCSISYDFIGNQETFDADAHYLLQTVFKEKLIPASPHRYNTTQQLGYIYIRDISPSLRKALMKHYSRDAQMFGYHLN